MTGFHKKLLSAGVLVTTFIVAKLIFLYVNTTLSNIVCNFTSLYGVLLKFNMKTVVLATVGYDIVMLWVTFLCYKRPATEKFIPAICLYAGYLVATGFNTLYSTFTVISMSADANATEIAMLVGCAVIFMFPIIAFVEIMLAQNELIDFEEAVENGLLTDESNTDTTKDTKK